jgi:hypothetical protein
MNVAHDASRVDEAAAAEAATRQGRLDASYRAGYRSVHDLFADLQRREKSLQFAQLESVEATRRFDAATEHMHARLVLLAREERAARTDLHTMKRVSRELWAHCGHLAQKCRTAVAHLRAAERDRMARLDPLIRALRTADAATQVRARDDNDRPARDAAGTWASGDGGVRSALRQRAASILGTPLTRSRGASTIHADSTTGSASGTNKSAGAANSGGKGKQAAASSSLGHILVGVFAAIIAGLILKAAIFALLS